MYVYVYVHSYRQRGWYRQVSECHVWFRVLENSSSSSRSHSRQMSDVDLVSVSLCVWLRLHGFHLDVVQLRCVGVCV